MRIPMAALAAFFMLALPALAQEVVVAPPNTVVSIPVGSWVDTAFNVWGVAIVSYVVFALRNMLSAFGPRVNAILLTAQVEQLMQRGVTYAVNSVVGATRDKVWTVEIRNAVLREIVTYALVRGSDAVKAFMGTPAAMAEMGFSRIDMPATDGVPKLAILPDAPKPDFVTIGDQAAAAAKRQDIAATLKEKMAA